MFKTKRGLSRVEIRVFANKVRELFGIEELMEVPILKVMEVGLPAIIPGFHLEIVKDIDLDADARAYPSESRITIRESVYNAAYSGDGRSRFTIAHEIGHLLIHTEGNFSFARNEENIPAYLNPEWQANTFAGEFLAPPVLIKGMTEDEIVRKCKVSRLVARIQMEYT